MYKIASDKRQATLHRGNLKDWVGAKEEILTPEQQLRQLQDASRILHDRMKAIPDKEERKQVGLEKFALQEQIAALKKEIRGTNKAGRDLNDFIVDAAKQILSKTQFQIILRAAKRDWEAAEKAKEESL